LTLTPGTPFRRSFPLLLTSFVNRCGTIGLSVFPMLLVERKLSVGTSAWVMTGVRSASVLGTLAGGWLCDRVGLRATILLSFAVSGLGMGALPWAPVAWGPWGLLSLGFLAEGAMSFFPSSSRLYLVELVPAREHQESIGWLRAANNLGQILCFSVGWLFAGSGVGPLMLFDSGTSWLAALIGLRLLPCEGDRPMPAPWAPPEAALPKAGSLLLGTVLVSAAFSFLYQLFMVGAAARFKLELGNDGLRLYSQSMVINTVLCTLLAVHMARMLKRPGPAMALGTMLVTAGGILIAYGPLTRPCVYLGAFVLTLGEVVYAAVAQLTVMRLMPSHRRSGVLYSWTVAAQVLGRAAGGAAAFPWVIATRHGLSWALALMTLATAFCWICREELDRRVRCP
jgi:MFS family permease